tara:strand:- start:387 stop:716 length:330 start_codon:yes stop_codon:yes gene_type:complete
LIGDYRHNVVSVPKEKRSKECGRGLWDDFYQPIKINNGLITFSKEIITPKIVQATQQITGLMRMVIYRKLIRHTVREKNTIWQKKENLHESLYCVFYLVDRLISPRSLK